METNNKDKIYIISQAEKPIKIVFENSPLEIKDGKIYYKIPIDALGIKFGMICEKDFTPEQWREIDLSEVK